MGIAGSHERIGGAADLRVEDPAQRALVETLCLRDRGEGWCPRRPQSQSHQPALHREYAGRRVDAAIASIGRELEVGGVEVSLLEVLEEVDQE